MNDFINIYLNNNCLQLAKHDNADSMEKILLTIDSLKSANSTTVIHAVKDPIQTLKDLYAYFPKITACGGLVSNERNEILFIYRRNKWDLPKGKLDEGETLTTCAVREVQEETGIGNVTLQNFLCNCYHIYFDKWQQKDVLKETYWYTMLSSSNQQLTPQLEEDIVAIEWISKKDSSKVYNNTYASIQEVLQNIGWTAPIS